MAPGSPKNGGQEMRQKAHILVSRNPNHTGARVLRTASAGIKLCLGRISDPFANPRVKRA